jgi:hypothetical protein
LAERIDWSEASSNIRAVWHSDELVVWNRPIAPGVHGSSAHLAVPRMPIAGRGLVIGDFIQRPTMGALEGLSHASIGAIVLCIHPARARIVPRQERTMLLRCESLEPPMSQMGQNAKTSQ